MNKDNLKNLSILYVEDDETIKRNTIITLEILDIKVISASNGQEGIEKFIEYQDSIDLIITDLSMPIMNGLDMIEKIKEIQKDIPVIITTAHQEINYLKKAIELNITSYILKPVQIQNIIDSIEKIMEPINLKKELIKKNEELIELNNSLEEKIKIRTKELEILASTDPLTGVNNRRNFFKLAKKRFKNEGNNLYAVMIDIDNFKKINDNFGHKAGDEVLISVTSEVTKNLFDSDIIGRMGGEEFAVVCNGEKEEVLQRIDQIRSSVENLTLNDTKVTISLGVSKKIDTDGNIDAVLSRADQALYKVKNTGKNRSLFRAT